MGALRAAEMGPYGMLGIGEIHRRFATGEYQRDDEVAVVHGPAESGFRAGSHALVNIRHGLDLALREGVLSRSAHADLSSFAEHTYYPDRHWSVVLSRAEERHNLDRSASARLRAIARSEDSDLKLADALQSLRFVAAAEPDSLRPRELPQFEATNAWLWFLETEGRPPETDPAR